MSNSLFYVCSGLVIEAHLVHNQDLCILVAFVYWLLSIFSHVLLSRGGGVTSTHNKWGCAILTKKVAPRNPGTYLKLRPKSPKTYLKLRPKNPGTRNARLSVCMRKLTTQIRKSLISTPRFSFTYFIRGFYYLTFVL